MGQSASASSLRSLSSFSGQRSKHSSSAAAVTSFVGKHPFPAPLSMPEPDDISPEARDHTVDLPDECLAMVFQSLGAGDRKQCSLVCRRWLAVEGQSRYRLSLDACAELLGVAPAILARYDSVTKLALKCDRHADSIGDDALALVASYCPNLTRLKIRACRAVTDAGMATVARHCLGLRKLTVGSCTFGAKGIDAILRGCHHLEELSINRLRGLPDALSAATASDPIPGAASLRSICMKELYNGQCFASLISGSPNLKTLKLFRCSGEWDQLLEDVAENVPGIAEIHLEKLQVGDRGLAALSACVDLEILHLVKTPECTDVGLAAVADRCHLLRKIHIDGWKANRIGDEGLMAIARQCPKLQELVLIGVNPTARSLGLIAGNCRNLERLALCGSETFGDAEITCIASKCMALKKLCIKGCPVSDAGMGALAAGCPKLVKVKVKKCRGVTLECADRLMATREGMLAVNLDTAGLGEHANVGESGMPENASERAPPLVVPISTARTMAWKARIGVLTGRNFDKFVASTWRRWSHGSSSSSNVTDT